MDFKVGITCYYINYEDNKILRGTILEIKNNITPYTNLTGSNPVLYAKIRKLDTFGYKITARKLNEIFHTKEECLKILEQKEQKIKDNYSRKINTAADLISFMYNNNIGSKKQTNNIDLSYAHDVVVEKAKELLGIDLNERSE